MYECLSVVSVVSVMSVLNIVLSEMLLLKVALSVVFNVLGIEYVECVDYSECFDVLIVLDMSNVLICIVF